MKLTFHESRMTKLRSIESRGFTLVELLVVIAIIGVLVALLLPAIQAAREAARRTQCSNNLRQIGLAVLNFESAKGRLPYGSKCTDATLGPTNKWLSTWTLEILPYLELQSLYDIWDSPERIPITLTNLSSLPTMMSPTNQRLRETFVASYLCPSDVDTSQLQRPETGPGTALDWAPGSYRAMAGYTPLDFNDSGKTFWDNPQLMEKHFWDGTSSPQAKLEWQGPMHVTLVGPLAGEKLKAVELRNITDGTSRTLLVGEYETQTFESTAGDKRTLWAYPYAYYNQSNAMAESRYLLGDYAKCTNLPGSSPGERCKRAFGSLHVGGTIQWVRCDGSVFSFGPDVDIEAFVAMGTIAGIDSWETKAME